MTDIVRTDTGQLLNNRACNRLIADAGYKTQITDKTSDATLAVWGEKVFGVESGFTFVRAADTEAHGPDYRKTGYAEKGVDNIWRPIWEPKTYDMDQERANAVRQINAHFQQMANTGSGLYPEFEVQTWRDQEAEAKAYDAWVTGSMQPGAKPPTPTLDDIATERTAVLAAGGSETVVTVADLYQRVLANAAAWRPTARKLSGQRQGYVDRIYLAADKIAIDAVLADLPATPETA